VRWQVKSGAMSFARFSTDDTGGKIRGTVAAGDSLTTRCRRLAAQGVVEIPELQKLLRYICENGFEHHVAANFPALLLPFMKLRHAIWAGICTRIVSDRVLRRSRAVNPMAIGAGVDFGTLSVRCPSWISVAAC